MDVTYLLYLRDGCDLFTIPDIQMVTYLLYLRDGCDLFTVPERWMRPISYTYLRDILPINTDTAGLEIDKWLGKLINYYYNLRRTPKTKGKIYRVIS